MRTSENPQTKKVVKQTQPTRATYKGFIKFGIMNIGVKGYSATATESKTAFKQISSCCNSPISMKRICKKCGKEAIYQELKKGFELQKPSKKSDGEYVILEKEEIEQLYQARGNIEIVGFTDRNMIDDIYFDSQKYYLDADKGNDYHFALFQKALEKSGKIAIAKVVLSKKDRIVLIEAYQNCVKLQTLKYFEEIRKTIDTAEVNVNAEELDLAVLLMEKQGIDFDISSYENNFENSIRQMITDKMEGKPIEIKIEQPIAVSQANILSDLKKSLQLAEA